MDRHHLTLRVALPRPREVAAAVLALGFAGLPVLRAWGLQWGAREDELEARLPGDALTPGAQLVATRAVGICAPPADVWPWIAQLGQERAGFYSYDALENLVGCRVRSAERVVRAWQDVATGDTVRLHPRIALEVAAVDVGRALVLRGADDETPGPPYAFTWSFVLRPDGRGGTRLVVRERYAYRTTWARLVAEPTCAVSAVMTGGMLRGVRRRVHEARGVRPGG